MEFFFLSAVNESEDADGQQGIKVFMLTAESSGKRTYAEVSN